MMSVAARSAVSAVDYYIHLREDNHRTQEGVREDYYAREGKGVWFGAGAKRLDLEGEVRRDDFAALARGYAPDGTALTQNASDSGRCALYDCTFSLVKSGSNAWAIGDPEARAKIEQAMLEATKETLSEMQERFIVTRRRKGGTGGRERAEMVAALWMHGTSRDLDEDLHVHATILNAGRRTDGSWGTIDGKQFFGWQKVCGAIFRIHAEQKLRIHGFETERDGEAFRLMCVPRDLERASSQARARIEKVMAERGVSGAAAAEVANLDTRKAKQHVPIEVLRARWCERAAEYGFTAAHARAREAPVPELALPDVQQVLDKATEQRAVVKAKELEYAALAEAMGTGVGRIKAAEFYRSAIERAACLVNERGDVRYSTAELVALERSIIENAKARVSETWHHLADGEVERAIHAIETRNGYPLSREQRDAIQHLASRSGGVAVVIGDAGTGKSTALEAIREAYEREGFRVLGCAVQGNAAAGLQASTGIESSTIHSLLGRVDLGRETLDPYTILVVDEAGRVDSRLMHRLVTATRERGAKLMLVGDHKQLQPIGPGATLRHLVQEVGCARLTEIHRQRDEWHRLTVRDMSQGEAAKAMLQYIDRGMVSVEKTHRAAVKVCAQKYLAGREQVGAEKTLALAGTNKLVNDLNASIRGELQKHGELSGEREYRIESGSIRFAAGDRVVLTRNNHPRDLKNGDMGTVLRAEKDTITIRLDRDGSGRQIDIRKYQHVCHGYAITTHRAQGATVERTVVYATARTSREMAYVQASRARDATEWVTTRHNVEKLAGQVTPTEKMIRYAEAIEAVRLERHEKASLPENCRDSFTACRDYLNQHAYYRFGENREIDNPHLSEFREVVQAMSQSQRAESTLDYSPVAGQTPAKHPEQEHERPELGI